MTVESLPPQAGAGEGVGAAPVVPSTKLLLAATAAPRASSRSTLPSTLPSLGQTWVVRAVYGGSNGAPPTTWIVP